MGPAAHFLIHFCGTTFPRRVAVKDALALVSPSSCGPLPSEPQAPPSCSAGTAGNSDQSHESRRPAGRLCQRRGGGADCVRDRAGAAGARRSSRVRHRFRRRIHVMQKNYGVLLVSQFTLYGVLKGNKPDFHVAMPPQSAKSFYDSVVERFRKAYSPDAIKDGIFGAKMKVNLVNDGPVTMQLDSSASAKNTANTVEDSS
ncbi:D-aminoacyl-tRNA deacylase isoform X1 [Punica granatum]|uniref:D-aminoacyl-tRNA deacylase n=1 Tax=Punica granatum TaxID=22663 RepID=A0A6P8CYI6_PUNGR|nr:D-aminoacyl-tRNA deacylase isoform X1 [Punica granatum]